MKPTLLLLALVAMLAVVAFVALREDACVPDRVGSCARTPTMPGGM